ncbi:hypothetical protein T440DRAFT_493354 [Plenodomus tracheiphilus IPT5]|uniref:Clr5 domain-containing protein n=1 Tax=Plenodomus tracheiphilus IPT5 TaxID=1408161 RepID=A0A6A7ATV0_9PLEO|nr:hypothetical protein T440DRAFT_493354 [Plenodomus tracheiphilus IPT5]
MTKDWGAVHDEIRALSFVQKKPLEEIRELMERKYKFRASTRAYRMKLKEWGLQRHKPRRSLTQRPVAKDIDNSSDDQDSSETVEPALRRAFHQPANWDGITVPDTVDESRLLSPHFSNVLNQESPLEVPEFMLNMLSAVLENDAQKLETMIIDNVGHINDAVGLPFGHAGRFFDYPLIETMKILQHPGQRLLDIACGMPCGPVVWVLLSYGATGSENPPGTDLALYNAIKNNRPYTIQALLTPGRSKVNGLPGATWKPLMQAVLQNVPEATSEYWAAQLDKDELECLRLFIAKGADLLIAYHGFPCETTTSKTFQHQAVWHSTPKLAELIIDSIPPESGEGCSRILHELLGSCPHVRDHPADTLRNVKEILHKGIDTKLFDMNGITPLERCMERSPDTHLVTLLRLLMEHGADPEDRDGNGTACYIRVARVFKESNLADEVMQAMIPYFHPTCEQVFASIRPDTDILLCIQNNIPHDVRSVFQRAYLAVLSTRFLDNITRTPRLRALDNEEKNEIIRILSIRKEANIATYTFSQELVINILAGQNSLTFTHTYPLPIQSK